MKTFSQFIFEAQKKDEAEFGKHTGGLVPKKKRTPGQQHEYEKERRQNLGQRKIFDLMKKRIEEEGGSPYQQYKVKPQPKPSTPPEGWEDFKKKYLHGKIEKQPKSGQ